MKIWQKNFDVNEIIERFTIGKDRDLDLDLAWFDVVGSIAHIRMLLEINLLSEDEYERLYNGLRAILKEIESKKFKIHEGVEDIHSQVEILLTNSLGEVGKKIHSGRSRNDQILLDLKLFMRHNIKEIVELTHNLFNRLINLSESYKHILMPGYTHFQVAMPSSFGLWFGAYAESLTDDLRYLKAAFDIINQNPLGSAAGYGTSFPVNRQLTTELLGFDDMNYNVIYAQMGRGKAEKILANSMGLIAETLGRLSADVCLYMGQNYGFISFPDEYTTGSSIMPHKKNPDVFELIRGRCNKIKALTNGISLLTTNLPAGYHRDMQLIKEDLFDAITSLKDCLYIAEFMLSHIEVNDNILEDDRYRYIYSVEKVNALVLEGMSFRDAYKKVAKMIEDGTYQSDHEVRHTHIGSIGNLSNDKILEKMEPLIEYFNDKFNAIRMKLDHLSGSNPG